MIISFHLPYAANYQKNIAEAKPEPKTDKPVTNTED